MGASSLIKGGAEIGYKSALVSLDAQGGHIVSKHIGQTEQALLTRLQNSRIPAATSFNNATTAAKVVGSTLYNNKSIINT